MNHLHEMSDTEHLISRNQTRIFNHPDIRQHPRTVLAAVSLCGFGVLCLIAGLSLQFTTGKDSLAFFILTGMTLVPGLFACGYILRILNKVPGYTWETLPSYDD
jgi:hypothetical protein